MRDLSSFSAYTAPPAPPVVLGLRWLVRATLAALVGIVLAISSAPPVTLAYTHLPLGQHACRCGDRAALEMAP